MTAESGYMRSSAGEPAWSSTVPATLDINGLQTLIDVLAGRGYTVIGPTVSGTR